MTWAATSIAKRSPPISTGSRPAVGPAELQGHLDGCAGCRAWYAAASRVTRLARLAPAEPMPDLAPAVLAALAPPRSLRRRLVAAARAALVVVAFVQALLAWSGALTGRDGMVTGHVAHEVGAWNLALAVAFLAAATRPRTAEALVAPVGVFVAVLAVSAVSDAVAGDLRAGRLATHLLVAAGLALLVTVARAHPLLPAVPPADGSVPRHRPPGAAPDRPGRGAGAGRTGATGLGKGRIGGVSLTLAPARRSAALLALLAGWAVLAVAGAAPALAHATVVSTDPADGSRLEAAPAKVSITFSEDVAVNSGFLKVVDADGEQVSQGEPAGTGREVSVPLRSGLGDGSYIVSYRIVSADSHPISGAFSFVVGDGPLVAASGAVIGGTTDPVVDVVFTVARWVAFAGVMLFGGLAFLVLCWPAGRTDPRARRLVWTGWGACAAGAVLGLLLEGPYAAGTGILDAFRPSLLSDTLATTYGRMLCARLVLLGVLAVLAVRLLRDQEEQPEKTRARDEDLAAIAGLGVLATYGGVGHAAAGSQPTLALLSDTTHLAAGSVWIGGLTMLAACLLPSRRTGELAEALPRFSRIALGAVAVLAVTGTYQAWREVAPLAALWTTEYGRLLLLKIIGFLTLVGLGNFSRQAVRRRYVTPVAHAMSTSDTAEIAESEEDRMLGRLRASVGFEVLIAAAVLAVTALLVSTAPARATYAKPFDATVQLASGGSAAVSVSPARAGTNSVQVTVLDSQGRPADAREVTMTAALPVEQIGPLPVTLNRTGTGVYSAPAAALPRPGTWELVLRVQVSEFDRDVAQVDVPVS